MKTIVEQFETMCRQHDLTYEYSDDHSVWQRGSQSLAEVERFARENFEDKSEASAIWNRIVDEKLLEGYRDQFYREF